MKKKILLVEYATTTIELIKDVLSSPIFAITIAGEGDSAKQRLHEEPFDLMITAAMLPKFHGFSLSQYAAQHFPGIKIIITSHIYKGMEYKHQAILQYKADDFFEIPFNKDTFKRRVIELLNIDEKDITAYDKLNTSQVPISDTAKIPTLKTIEEENKKLSSEDLFGDIIKQVHSSDVYEIKLDKETKEIPKITQVITPPVTQVITPPVTQLVTPLKAPPVTKLMEKPGKSSSSQATQKIDLDLLEMLKLESKVKEEKKFRDKKIEDEVSKKFEDTLSGLGITPKKPPIPPKAQPPVDVDGLSGYELLGLIGRGGMAEIYKAKRKGIKGFEKIIALKKILTGYGEDVKYIEMFVDEAKIAAQLSHPNIVQIYDLGKKDDYYFIAMEYVPGKDLRIILQKLAQKSINMPEELSIYLVLKILEALNYAHTARDANNRKLEIVHRDVSPPNILVSYDGNIKLTDFGVSKASTKMHQTLAGALKGKLLYMSPEQARGEENIDFRSDLYSAGIILFELITGQKLFLGSSDIVTLKKVQEGHIIKPSQIKKGIDSDLETIILKALEKDMNKRYQKASEMSRDLDTYLVKNYTSYPEPNHIANYIYTLFKEEIIKEGIDIHINPIPYPIRKTVKQAEKEPPKKEVEIVKNEAPEQDIVELTLEEQIIEEKPLPSVQKTETYKMSPPAPKQDEFQPLIEINFDDDMPIVQPPKQPETTPKTRPLSPVQTPPQTLSQDTHQKPGTPAFPILSEIDEPPLETKKKRYLLVILIILIIILAAVIGYFIISNSSSNKYKPAPSPGAQTPGAVSSKTDSQPTQVSGELPTPTQKDLTGASTTTPPSTTPSKPGDSKSQTSTVTTPPPQGADNKKTQTDPTQKQDTPKEAETKPKPAETKVIPEPEKPKTMESEKPTEQVVEVKKQTPEPAPPPKEEKNEGIKEGDILSPNDVDTQAIPVTTPPILLTHGIQRLLFSDEQVLVSYLVDQNGNVEIVKILKKSNLEKINTIIKDTIKTWKFKPATKNNIKVKVWKNQWLSINKAIN